MTHRPHALQELKQRLREISDLQAAAALLHWDQATYMPPGGAAARARQAATLAHVIHQKQTDAALGRLLDTLAAHSDALDEQDAALLRVARRDYERATRLPDTFVAELSQHIATTYQVWADARPRNDWAAVAPYLECTLALSRRYAEYFPEYEHIADPLIDRADEGMTVARLRPLFTTLRARLVPLVQAISARPPIDAACVLQHFPEAEQLAFGELAIRRMGYDFTRGRQDKTHHPFMIKLSVGDVRITTRVDEHDFCYAFFTTVHEMGHALYEQGIDPAYEGTPLAEGASSGVHESQSRLWENQIARSRMFWQYFYPLLQAAFPRQLAQVDLETFYRAINKVERSLIRTEADEVTYNLHVIIRFDLEVELLEGRLAIRDLPEAWRARYQSDLGIAPPDDRDGVLQDVHWFGGLIGGAFQSYTLGNIMSAAFYAAAVRAHPSIPTEIAAGEFGTLHGWLREQIYRHGQTYPPAELVRRVTGSDLTLEPYLHYLESKFAELYHLPLPLTA